MNQTAHVRTTVEVNFRHLKRAIIGVWIAVGIETITLALLVLIIIGVID